MDIVYYEPGSGCQDSEFLAKLAEQIFSLKGTTPADEELAVIAQHMTDDIDRAQGLKVPASLTHGRRCILTTTLISRQHLPARMLCNPLIPIVVAEGDSSKILMLPGKYWPAGLKEWWLGGHPDESHLAEATWLKRIAGGLLTSMMSLVFGWVGGNVVVGVAIGEQPVNLAAAGWAIGPLLVAAWFLTLSYRMFTGRGRRSDRGLVAPWTLLVFSFGIIALGGFALYAMWPEFEWKIAFGGLLFAFLGVKGVMLALKRL